MGGKAGNLIREPWQPRSLGATQWIAPLPQSRRRSRRAAQTSRHLHRWGRVPHRGTISTGPPHPSSVERGRPTMDGRGIKSDRFGTRGSTCEAIGESLSGSRQGARAFQPLAIPQGRRGLCLRTGSGITDARPCSRALPPPRTTWVK